MKNSILVSVAEVNEALLEELVRANVGIEISYFSNPLVLEKANLAEEITRHYHLLKDFPLPKTIHGAFYDLNPTARDPKILEVCRFRILQSLEIAAEFGMKKIVFHTNYIHSNHSEYKKFWINKQISFWQEFIPTLEKWDICIYLENTREENPDYIYQIIKGLNSKYFSICYDTGHSHCFTESKISPVEWVNAYQNELGYIHLHSNFGKTDDHIAFTKGSVNFEGFFEKLSTLESNPYIIIEVKKREDYVLSLAALRQLTP